MTSSVVSNHQSQLIEITVTANFESKASYTMWSLGFLLTVGSTLLIQQSDAFQLISRGMTGMRKQASPRPYSRETITTTTLMSGPRFKDSSLDWNERSLAGAMAAAAFSLSMIMAPLPAFADGQTKEFKFPPIDFSDPNRCRLNSSSMGQANAARDKLYDLRQCDMGGVDAAGFDLSGVST
jgi:hypothetical protein